MRPDQSITKKFFATAVTYMFQRAMLSISAANVEHYCAAFLRTAKYFYNFSMISCFIWRITSLRSL